MTIPQRIITQLFQSSTPDCPKNIESTFNAFRSLMGWQEFRALLVEYNFELPKDLHILLRKYERNNRTQKNYNHEHPRNRNVLPRKDTNAKFDKVLVSNNVQRANETPDNAMARTSHG